MKTRLYLIPICILFVSLWVGGCASGEDVMEVGEAVVSLPSTPIPATETAVPPTSTPIPLTATSTATATVIPTNTPIPPTETAVPTVEPTVTTEEAPTADVEYLVTPEAQAIPLLPQLVTSADVNTLDNELEIYEWQLVQEIGWDNRVCHAFYGVSWSVNPNLGINCIFPKPNDFPFEQAVEAMFDMGILDDSFSALLSPYNTYDHEVALYGGQLDNGHAVFDLFVGDVGETEFYWASVSLGVPGGYTVEDVYVDYGDSIETFLYSIIQINIDRRDG